MLRLALFHGTNLAVLLVLSLGLQVLGIEGPLAANGVDLDLTALLAFAGVIGFGGALVSLVLSKPMAGAPMRVRVIEVPRNAAERWLVEIVRDQARRAGIGMPEVGVFDHPSPNAFATGWRRGAARRRPGDHPSAQWAARSAFMRCSVGSTVRSDEA